MTWIYNLAMMVFAVVSIPKFLVRLRQAEDPKRLLAERFGYLTEEFCARFRGEKTLWLHAVSVGEVMAAGRFLELFGARYPDWKVALSTTTPTGHTVARRFASGRVCVFYAPVDLSSVVRRVIRAVNPKLIVLMETEIWPNLISEAAGAGIPIGIVNGRISPRSYRRYRFVRFWTRSVLNRLSFCLAQSERDRDYFLRLGMDPAKIVLSGNMKLDRPLTAGREKGEEKTGQARRPGPVLIGGSTHWNEEELLLRIVKALRPDFPALQLILAPRHPERVGKVVEAVERYGFKPALLSRGSDTSIDGVLVVDRMGVLPSLYPRADLVFVGGSLTRRGGQNPIEAAQCAKPVLHGPHVFNFHELYRALDEGGAAFEVGSETELAERIRLLLGEPEKTRQMGSRARAIVESMTGASERTLDYLSREILNHTTQLAAAAAAAK